LVNEFIVITDTIPPGAPTLVTPQANTYDNTPEFIWNYTADADSFNLLITGLSKDEINIMTADTTYIPVDPLANGTYYWKVRAEDNVGNLGDFSDSLVFTILPPDIPTLVLPLDNDTSNNQLPQFIWNFSNDADSFNIVYTGPTKDEISVMTTDTTFTVADSLIEGNYTWKVRAKDEYGFYGNFSVERTFTLDLTPPSVPILVSPSNGATITTESQCLIWNTSSEAVLFNLVAGGVDVNLTDTAYTIEFGRGSYTWKVRAQDAFGNWSLFCDIWGFTVQIPDWTQRESIPAALDVKPGKYVKSGGAMVAVNTDLYAFYGNKSKYFYKYNTGTKGSWTVMESIPYGVKSTDPTRINKKTPNKGSALCWDNNNTIFATKGNTNEFWAYYIDTDTWLQKAFVPVPKKYKGGTSITFYDGKIYLLAGNQKTSDPTNFYSYDPTADTAGGEPWISLSSAPFTPNNKKWKDGSAITVVSNIIYALKGGDKYNVFCAYDVLVGSWVEIESIPRVHPMLGKKTKVKDGGAIAGSGTVLYAIKGGGKQDLWLYTPGTPGVWTPLETIPRLHKKSVPKTGAALAYASNGKLFLLKGNNTLELWKYIPAGMLDAKTQISNANTNMQIEHTFRQIPGDKLIELVPNPFGKHAVIHYSVPVSGRISIKLYNISGRCFETLVDNYQTAGNYTLGIDNQSSKISKGVYFLKYEFMGNALSERAAQTIKVVIE
jgi:hypothetical protein